MRSPDARPNLPSATVISLAAKKASKSAATAQDHYRQTLLDAVDALAEMKDIIMSAAVQAASYGPLRTWSEAQPPGTIATFSPELLIGTGDEHVAELAFVQQRLAGALEHFRHSEIEAVSVRASEALAADSDDEPLALTHVGLAASWVTGRLSFTSFGPGIQFESADTVLARDLDTDIAALCESEVDLVVCPLSEAEMHRYGMAEVAPSGRSAGLSVLLTALSGATDERALDRDLALCRVMREAVLGGKRVAVLADVRTDRAAALVAAVLVLLGVPSRRAAAGVNAAKSGALRSRMWRAWLHALATRAEALDLILDTYESKET